MLKMLYIYTAAQALFVYSATTKGHPANKMNTIK